ncbi:MAG: F0F1 ATP synthase subunit B [Peptococcaceae bacterium]|nr:F0F1 ATP synthase subunit B [Peptococcaceae bacterium]MBO5115268.1 F0F1 ATP synthase subunit B [Peptococcaceae bacterium]MBO5140439.1 F0F1 ATP synthase subunit B [Peptococcaceae bacterium]MBO5301663.1 F0F1 ATP synthase subunit B [Peptococcaceae bacterium]MBO5365065.1 F0F1 ATP synthase subunit B [Peptococcaceae bacterium]
MCVEIHPSTIIFAIINFAILVVGLKVFLYKPVCNMLDSRREEVINNLNSAEEAKLEAQKLKDEYAAQIQNARAEAQDIINQAAKIGEQTKADIVTEAREEASRLTAKAQAEIAREKTEALNEIRNEIADLAVLAASKVVGKTIDVADHQNMVDNFVKEVGEAK